MNARKETAEQMVSATMAANHNSLVRRMIPIETAIMRGLTDMQLFSGEGTRTCDQPLNHACANSLQSAHSTLTTESFGECCGKRS